MIVKLGVLLLHTHANLPDPAEVVHGGYLLALHFLVFLYHLVQKLHPRWRHGYLSLTGLLMLTHFLQLVECMWHECLGLLGLLVYFVALVYVVLGLDDPHLAHGRHLTHSLHVLQGRVLLLYLLQLFVYNFFFHFFLDVILAILDVVTLNRKELLLVYDVLVLGYLSARPIQVVPRLPHWLWQLILVIFHDWHLSRYLLSTSWLGASHVGGMDLPGRLLICLFLQFFWWKVAYMNIGANHLWLLNHLSWRWTFDNFWNRRTIKHLGRLS